MSSELDKFGDELKRRNQARKAETLERAATSLRQREWREAWDKLSSDQEYLNTIGGGVLGSRIIPWHDETEVIVRELAGVVADHGFADVVSAIVLRLGRWLTEVDAPNEFHYPTAVLRPGFGDYEGEQFTEFIEEMLSAAIVLDGAIKQREPLIPDSVDPKNLSSDSWERLGREVSAAPSMPNEPQRIEKSTSPNAENEHYVLPNCFDVPLDDRTFGDLLCDVKCAEAMDKDANGDKSHMMRSFHARAASQRRADHQSWPGVGRLQLVLESQGRGLISADLIWFRANKCLAWGIETPSQFDEMRLLEIESRLTGGNTSGEQSDVKHFASVVTSSVKPDSKTPPANKWSSYNIEEVEKLTPKLPGSIRESAEWVPSLKKNSEYFSREMRTVKDYREVRFGGRFSSCRTFGIDADGNRWRRKTADRGHVFYYIPDLK